MDLIVLNYHFPPDPSMGGMRWSGLSKYLARTGARIHVVASGPKDAIEHLPSGVVVHRVARRRTLNDVYRGYREAAISGRSPEPAAGTSVPEPGVAPPRGGVFAGLRQELSWLMAFPDDSRGWILRALRATLRIAKEHPPTAIVSSGPPHAVHLIGTAVASWRRLPHVVDLRDPWGTHRYDPRIWWQSIYAHRVGRITLPFLERLVFRRASMIVANTCRLRDLLRSRFPDARVEWIPNGVDLERIPNGSGEPRFPGLSIAYAGTLYGGRGLDEIMKAFAEFLAKHPEARAAGSRLRVAGHMEPGHAEAFLAQRRVFGLDDSVEHVGMLTREGALDFARASSLSLVLAQAQELQVPGKVYELAVLGGAVLVIAEQESASADEAERLGLHWAEPTDQQGLVGILEQVWAGREGERAPPNERVSYESIAVDVRELLGRVIPGARADALRS